LTSFSRHLTPAISFSFMCMCTVQYLYIHELCVCEREREGEINILYFINKWIHTLLKEKREEQKSDSQNPAGSVWVAQYTRCLSIYDDGRKFSSHTKYTHAA